MSWYSPAFAYKKAIVIPHANVSGGSDLPDFPVLISLGSADLKTTAYGGLLSSLLGFDLLFTDSAERRELAYELESYNPATGALVCWVRVPRLSVSQDTVIYLYFGNPTLIAPLSNPVGTWDSAFTSVWHLGDSITLNAYDSTTNNVGYPQTATAGSGQINGGAAFLGGQTIQSLNTGGLDMSSSSSLVLYGSTTHDSTLTSACDMATLNNGTETSVSTTVTGTNIYAEIQSQGGTVASVASIPGTPTGKGWVYQPGAGTFAAGNWNATVTLAAAHLGGTGDITIRFFKYSGGSYSSIGTMNTAITGVAKTTYTFNATAMSSISFGASDLVYVDLWWHDTSQNADNPTVSVSSSSSAGVDSDLVVGTATFTPNGWVGQTITLSSWAKRSRTGTWQTLIAHGTGTGRDYDFAFSGGGTYAGSATGSSADQLVFLYRDTGDTTWQCFASSSTYTDTTNWHHYALTYTYGLPSSATLYVDGQPATGSWTNGTGSVPPFASFDNLALGSTTDQGDGYWGSLDEVHVSQGVARSSGWLATEYSNQQSPQTFIRAGETVPSTGNTDLVLITAYGTTTAQTSALQFNQQARGVNLALTILTSLNWSTGLALTVTLLGLDETSGAMNILASWTSNTTGAQVFSYYPGLQASSTVTADGLPRVWQVNVSPATNDAASYTVSASLIV